MYIPDMYVHMLCIMSVCIIIQYILYIGPNQIKTYMHRYEFTSIIQILLVECVRAR